MKFKDYDKKIIGTSINNLFDKDENQIGGSIQNMIIPSVLFVSNKMYSNKNSFLVEKKDEILPVDFFNKFFNKEKNKTRRKLKKLKNKTRRK